MLNVAPPLVSTRTPTLRLPTEADVRAIASTALRAPSADNGQPWRIDIDGATLSLALDEDRGTSDGIGPLAGLLSLGGMLESVVLEAARCGWHARVTGGPRAFEVSFVASERTSAAHATLASAIAARATDRAPYALRPLRRRLLDVLEAEGSADAVVRVTCERDAVACVARAHAMAEHVRFDAVNPQALQRWLRFDDESARATKDGLDVRLLELGPHERLFLRASRVRGFVPCARALGAGRLAAMRAEREVMASGGVGVIVQHGVADRAFVETGRTMMRLWLRATLRGLSFAPVMASALLPLARRLGHLKRTDQDARLEIVETSLREQFAIGRGWHVAFVFRFGVPTRAPALTSERRDLASFETPAEEA